MIEVQRTHGITRSGRKRAHQVGLPKMRIEAAVPTKPVACLLLAVVVADAQNCAKMDSSGDESRRDKNTYSLQRICNSLDSENIICADKIVLDRRRFAE